MGWVSLYLLTRLFRLISRLELLLLMIRREKGSDWIIMPIRFIDEQPAEPPKRENTILDEMPTWKIRKYFSSYGVSMGVVDPVYGVGQLVREDYQPQQNWPRHLFSDALYKQSAENVDKGYKQVSQEYMNLKTRPKSWLGRLAGNVASPINWVGTGAVALPLRSVQKF